MVPPLVTTPYDTLGDPRNLPHMMHSKRRKPFQIEIPKTLEEQTAKEDIMFYILFMFYLIIIYQNLSLLPCIPCELQLGLEKLILQTSQGIFHGFQTSARQSCRGISPNHNLHPQKIVVSYQNICLFH